MNSSLARFSALALLMVIFASCSSDGGENEQLQQRVTELEARLAQTDASDAQLQPSEASEPTSRPSATSSPTPVTASGPPPRPTSTNSPTPEPTATRLTTVLTRFIANTGGVGVAIRDDCQQSARRSGAWTERQEVRLFAIGEGRCRGWQLAVSDGQESWVRAEYLAEVRPTATAVPLATPAPSAPTTTAAPTPVPTVEVVLAVTAFCNAGFDTSVSCRASAENGLLASGRWAVWATVRDYDNVLYHLDGGPGLNKTGLSSAFASLSPGNHLLTLVETVSGLAVTSQPWSFAIVAPPAPAAPPNPFAAECAQYQKAYAESLASGAAGIFLNFLRERIDFYCR